MEWDFIDLFSMFQLSEIIFCTFLDVPAIHSKSWWCWWSDSADNLNFPQKDFLRTQKLSVWVPMNEEFWNVSQIKVKRCSKVLQKSPKWFTCSWFQIFGDFAFKLCIYRLLIYLCTFISKFCCRDLRTFSADFV